MKKSRTGWALVVVGACVWKAVGCSTETDPNGNTPLATVGTGAQPGRDASAGTNGVAGAGAGNTFGSGGGFTKPNDSSGGSTDPGPDACASFSQTPEEIIVYRDATVTDTVYDTVIDTITDTIVSYEPVALYVMMDRSPSMIGVASAFPNLWNDATAALTNFVNDPASAGLDIGLGVFPDIPLTDCSNPTSACCATPNVCGPPIVDIGPLPQNGANMIQGMQSAVPPNVFQPLTPTECALRGMIDQCIQHRNNTGEQCVAILVTDGAPTLCNGDPNYLANIVAEGLNQGILTFTLGLPGANLNFLNQLAEVGGTDCDPNGPNFACDLTTGSAGLINTLNTIRNTVKTTVKTQVSSQVASTVSSQITTQTTLSTKLDCQWGIPAPPDGETFDPTKVNLQVTTQDGTKTKFGYVESPDQCTAAGGGWYYDDVADPKDILVCPDSCQILTGLTGARVDILFGCETEPAKFQ